MLHWRTVSTRTLSILWKQHESIEQMQNSIAGGIAIEDVSVFLPDAVVRFSPTVFFLLAAIRSCSERRLPEYQANIIVAVLCSIHRPVVGGLQGEASRTDMAEAPLHEIGEGDGKYLGLIS